MSKFGIPDKSPNVNTGAFVPKLAQVPGTTVSVPASEYFTTGLEDEAVVSNSNAPEIADTVPEKVAVMVLSVESIAETVKICESKLPE